MHQEHPYIQESAMSPVGLYAIHQQPQERPNRDRGEVDRAKGSAAEGSPRQVVAGGRRGAGILGSQGGPKDRGRCGYGGMGYGLYVGAG